MSDITIIEGVLLCAKNAQLRANLTRRTIDFGYATTKGVCFFRARPFEGVMNLYERMYKKLTKMSLFTGVEE